MFIYLFIIKIGKLESCLDIFIYYIIIGEDQKIGYIISKYNYWDIFQIYLYILFGYVYLFIYYIKIGEGLKNWRIVWIYLFIILKLESCLDILYSNIIIWIYFGYIYIYYLDMFIYLFIIKIGKNQKIRGLFGYIISKYNYILDIFWIYLYILFKYVYLFIYYNKIGENCKIEGQLLFWIYYIQI